MKLKFYIYFCTLIFSAASANQSDHGKKSFEDQLEIEMQDGPKSMISGEKISSTVSSNDCTKHRDLRNESKVKYYEYASCEIEGISNALNGIIRRHYKNSSLKFVNLRVKYSVSTNGSIENITFLEPEFIEEILVRKLSSRLSLLKLASPNSSHKNLEINIGIK